MKVITVLNSDFDLLCDKLADNIKKDYSPDLIVGIATGGEYVANRVAEKLSIPKIIIKRQRKSTKHKSKFKLFKLLPYLPESILNILRTVEIKYNEWRFNSNGRMVNSCDVVFKYNSTHDLSTFKRVILIDDSVDSGGTLVDCIKFIKCYTDNETIVKTAALNITFKSPVINPDFYIYKDILLRCPWANDVVNKS